MAGEAHTICFLILFVEQWTFTLAGVAVEPSSTYTVLAFNLPEPDIGDYRVNMKIITPGKKVSEELPVGVKIFTFLWDIYHN